MPQFATGADQAEKAAKQGVFPGRAAVLTIKSGQMEFVRFLTDIGEGPGSIITIDTHVAIPTKDQPADYKGSNWPKAVSFVCANAPAFKIWKDGEPTDEYEEGYGHCWVHEHLAGREGKYGPLATPRTQIYGLCVLREPIMKGGKIAGFRDKTEEFKDDKGVTHQVPAIRMIVQSWRNFWGAVAASGYMSGTVRTRDYMIKRTDNEYDIAAGDADPKLTPGTDAWKRYDEALELMDISLEKQIEQLASEDWMRRWLDPTWKPPKKEGEAAQGGGQAAAGPAAAQEEEQAAAPEGDGQPSEEAIAAFRASLSEAASTGMPADAGS